jgi:hypothetical protein
MDCETESKIREIMRRHIDDACEEVSEAEITDFFWPAGFAERMANQMTQSIALMEESHEMSESDRGNNG